MHSFRYGAPQSPALVGSAVAVAVIATLVAGGCAKAPSSDPGSLPSSAPAEPTLAELPAVGRVNVVAPVGGSRYTATAAGDIFIPNGLGWVTRIDPKTGETKAVIQVSKGSSPPDIIAVVAAGDQIWVGHNAFGGLSRIDPSTNTVVERINLDLTVYGMVMDGADLWAISFEQGKVARINLQTKTLEASFDVGSPTGIAVGGGSVWVVEHFENARVVRIDPKTNTVAAEIPMGNAGGYTAKFGSGALWVSVNRGGRGVFRIDPATNTGELVRLGILTYDVAVHGGKVYAVGDNGTACTDPNSYLVRVDPAALAPDAAMRIECAAGLLPVGDSLWVFADDGKLQSYEIVPA